jgi:YfiH family protein
MLLDHSSFLGSGVLAVTSGRDVDFQTGTSVDSAGLSLAPEQKAWLRHRGMDQGVVFPKQIHTDIIWQVSRRDMRSAGIFQADAVVTDEPGLAIAVRTADCCPVFFYAPDKKVIAAVHAGWKSTRGRITAKTVEYMRRVWGVDPKVLRAVIGPCIRQDSYPVGEEFLAYFPQDVRRTASGSYFDLAGANTRQLKESGLCAENIFDSRLCTFKGADRFFSFRREKEAAGRMINVIMMEGGTV